MVDFRSRSYADGRSEMESYYGGSSGPSSYGIKGMQDLRSYSTSVYPTRTQVDHDNGNNSKDFKLKKAKSSTSWNFSDPDLPRKKRVASYKAYTVEGKLKGSLRKSFRWIKDRCFKLASGL